MKKKPKAKPTGKHARPIGREADRAAESELPAPIADESSNVNQISPESLRRLSRRLLEHQNGREPYAGEFVQRFECFCQSFHAVVASHVGSAAFHGLLWRALRMSQAEFPYLDRVTLEAASRCSFDVLQEPLGEAGTRPVEEALAVVLANLIWLLIKTVGYRFTFHVLHQVWPHVSIEESRSFLKD